MDRICILSINVRYISCHLRRLKATGFLLSQE